MDSIMDINQECSHDQTGDTEVYLNNDLSLDS